MSQDGAEAGPSTVSPNVVEGSQQQWRESNLSSTQQAAVALPPTDTSAIREGGQDERTYSKPFSPQEGAAALQSIYTLAVTEGSQPKWRHSNPSSAQEGAAALQSRDTPAALEENQQQGIQPPSTTTHNYFGSVSKYDLSNSSQISLGNPEHRGCVSQASLSIRIKQLNEVFEEIRTLQKAEDVLKCHNHVAVCGAPGDGKTSIALKICEKYLNKKYEVVFVDNIEEFPVDAIIQRQAHMLVVFDDIFGSVTFPSYLQKIKKVLTALADALVNFSVQEEQGKKKRELKKLNADKKNNEALLNEETKSFHKLRFIFTSRTYNWKEGCNRLHQFKINLFNPESIIDMTTTTLTSKEKESILNSFLKRNQMFDMSSQDKNTITQLQDNMFGFPLICQLYCTNPAFQMHKMTNFFQNPVSYLRGDLDTIIREGSSRSAALVLLVLCGGKMDIASFKSGKTCAALFEVVREEILPPCTRTDIGKEISNFTGTYCTVENHVASFSHPSIHDAAACALGHLNEMLLLEHCSLQLLYERVRLNRDDGFQLTHIDDVTNMIYVTSNLHSLVITRLAQGVREGNFRLTVGHPIFSNVQIASSFLTQIMMDLPKVVHAKDTTSGECFLYWVSLSTNRSLFDRSLSLMCRERGLSNSVVTDFYFGILGCIHHGNLQYLKRIVAALKQCDRFDVDRRTEDHKTLLMIAAESGQLDVFNFLLKEGADVSATDGRNYNSLHHSCKSGSKDIVKFLIKQFQHMINAGTEDGKTPAMLCAETGQLEILKLLVSHKETDVSLTDENNSDCLMLACQGGNTSIVKHLLSLKIFDINRQGGCFYQSAVMVAAERGHYDVYNLIVSEGADLSVIDKCRRDCLMLACKGGNTSIVKHLLSLKTFDINRQSGMWNQSAVMVAAERGLYDVYNLLVSEGADVSLIDERRRDCLMLACKGGNTSIVKHLLSLKTFDINRQSGMWNQSAVMVAAERGLYDVYNLLVSEGAEVSLIDERRRDCLMLACIGGNLSIVKHLLSLKTFDINRQGGIGNKSAVMVAAERGHYDVYNFIVSKGADLSLTDKNSSDCLMLACEGGNLSIVIHLLSLTTFDINRQGGIGNQSAVMVAAAWGHYDVYNLLVSEGADVSLIDERKMDCLMLACMGGYLSIVKHLLSLKTFDINRQGGILNQSAVMMAAEKGHYDVYNLLLSEGADVSLIDELKRDCLMLACKGGNMSIVKHLLSLKTFDINRQGGILNQSAVMMAAEKGHYDVYNLLLSEGADVSLIDVLKRDCLMLACKGGNMSIVKHLLSLKTFDINRQGGILNQSAVMMAAESRHYDVYNLLVSEGADVSLTDEDNNDCLMLACEGGNLSIVKHLLSLKTFDTNRQGGILNQSAVMMAAERGHYDVYNLLVSEGADLSLIDECKMDCLMLACEGGNLSIVKHLLSLKTFDINKQGGVGNQSAVMVAAAWGHYDVYNLLVSEGADVSLIDERKMDCLMLACMGGYLSIVKHLLSLKTFDINRQGGILNQSAVMMAAERGHYDVYNLLLSEGADVSLIDELKRDCLMLACKGGNMSIVKHLLSLKTFDINRQGGILNQSAVMMAAESRHYDVYNLLVSEGADVSLTDEDNNDCLMLACEGGNLSIVKHLLSLKTFDTNRQGGIGNQSAVMMAAERGHYDVYNLLVSEGADVSLTDEDNNDCLMLACEGGNTSIVKHLLSLKQFGQGQRGLEEYVTFAEQCHRQNIVTLMRSSST